MSSSIWKNHVELASKCQIEYFVIQETRNYNNRNRLLGGLCISWTLFSNKSRHRFHSPLSVIQPLFLIMMAGIETSPISRNDLVTAVSHPPPLEPLPSSSDGRPSRVPSTLILRSCRNALIFGKLLSVIRGLREMSSMNNRTGPRPVIEIGNVSRRSESSFNRHPRITRQRKLKASNCSNNGMKGRPSHLNLSVWSIQIQLPVYNHNVLLGMFTWSVDQLL